ncbi:MAG: beta-ketoacyl-[acyl-carrier-protein] synthase family protein [Gemmataceae bacterium]|nr:beta-ketoacyl-[acyl-carrier-protein] synthase family protein [Gemmataceae bacterium]
MRREPVVITGIGAATPLGSSYQDIADNLLAGRSGVRSITAFPVADHAAHIAGVIEKIPTYDVSPPLPPPVDQLPPIDRLGLWCATAALRDSGWWEKRGAMRIGIVLGAAAEWTSVWEWDGLAGGERVHQPEASRPTLVQRLCRRLDLSGPAVNVSAACASGNYAIALARRWLELGWADVCLAGGCDMALTPMTLAAFGNLRALSRRNDAPQCASRPFDLDRDGFVMAEGGVVFVLERMSTARQRSARVYAEVAGCGASSDAFHMVIPSSDPKPASIAIRHALADAQVNPADVDYINAHATSTPVGDIAEAKSLRLVFGSALDTVPVSSTKSMTGHLLTGAAAFEALACIVAMERKALPPTINLDKPDPECAVCHVPNQAQARPVRVTLSNSFGFGGSNTTLILRAA